MSRTFPDPDIPCGICGKEVTVDNYEMWYDPEQGKRVQYHFTCRNPEALPSEEKPQESSGPRRHQEEQVRELLDAHGEYYVRQTMQFIKDSRTDSPVMGGANKKDTESLEAILALLEQAETAARKTTLQQVSDHLDELHQGTEGAGFVHYGEMGEWLDEELKGVSNE